MPAWLHLTAYWASFNFKSICRPRLLCFRRSGRLLAKGFRKGNLYFLSASVGQAHHTRVSSSSSASLRTWHLRLAHASFTTIRSLVSTGSLKVDCNSASPSHICLGCQLGKHTKLPFSPCNKRADHFFEFIYADVWGPVPSSSLSGSRYVVVFIVTVDIHGFFYLCQILSF